MRVSVLIASHLNTQKRVATLGRAIESVFTQTRLPYRLCISYSHEEGPDLSGVDIKELEFLSDIIHSKSIIPVILKQEKRKLQFEHYNLLFKVLEPNLTDSDWFVFLDDDDLFHPLRIEKIFTDNNDVKVVKCFHSVLHYPEKRVFVSGIDEYCRYAVFWQIFRNFLTFLDSKSSDINYFVKRGLSDLLLGIYINKYYLEIPDVLYYQTKDYEIIHNYN